MKVKNMKKQDVFERIFSSLDVDSAGYIRKEDLIDSLAVRGILEDDIRIKETMTALDKYKDKDISIKDFRKIVGSNITLIEKALIGGLVIPDFKNFCSFITNLYNRTILNKGGKVSDCIPQLNSNSESYAVSICTVDGQRFNLGDYNKKFIAREVSKAINYCLAIEDRGEVDVHKNIGKEPREKSSNELTLNSNGIPHNPFNDAGSMMTASLIKPRLSPEKRFEHILSSWKELSGGIEPGFNKEAFEAEKKVSDDYYAVSYFMKKNKLLPKTSDINEYTDLLFKCLSIETTTEALAVIAATLANAGVRPTNGKNLLSHKTSRSCLSLMNSCGMGDYSSDFAFSIGLPAKSGISGSIILVVPDVMGVAIWSPRIDENGNSVKGLDFCRKLVDRFNFHAYDSVIKNLNKINPRLLKNETKIKECNGCLDAASKGDIHELQMLFASGVDLGEADYDGRTGIHLAASEGHLETVELFISKRVDVNPKDRWGGTPLADARRHGHTKVIELLERHGGKV